MASLYKKVISGKPYWYLREMGWVDGKPKMVSERYLGSAADIEALLDAREAGGWCPERTRHLAFGDVAAAWGLLAELGVAAMIDEVVGPRRPGCRVGGHLSGAGRAGPAGGPVLEARRSPTGGAPPRRTGSPRSAPRCWTTAGSGTPCTPCMPTRWPRIEEKLALAA